MNVNETFMCGKVNGVPQTTGDGDSMRADFVLTVMERKPNANGQWVDHPTQVPMYAFGNKSKVIKDYVVDGQELFVKGTYFNWTNKDNSVGHGFRVMNVELGFKPKSNVAPVGGGSDGPPAF